MPKTQINYQNTIIYKFVCNDLSVSDIYVGSTTDIRRRKAQHKQTCNNESNKNHNFKIYQIMRANGGFSNWTMLQIENFPCNNKAESSVRERHWLELLSATMNTQIPSRTQTEYYIDNKESILENKKEYYIDNKEQKQQYYIDNKESIQQYYTDNKDKINAKTTCQCGGKYTHTHLSKHCKSKKHLLYLQNLNNSKLNIIENQINDIAIN